MLSCPLTYIYLVYINARSHGRNTQHVVGSPSPRGEMRSLYCPTRCVKRRGRSLSACGGDDVGLERGSPDGNGPVMGVLADDADQ